MFNLSAILNLILQCNQVRTFVKPVDAGAKSEHDEVKDLFPSIESMEMLLKLSINPAAVGSLIKNDSNPDPNAIRFESQDGNVVSVSPRKEPNFSTIRGIANKFDIDEDGNWLGGSVRFHDSKDGAKLLIVFIPKIVIDAYLSISAIYQAGFAAGVQITAYNRVTYGQTSSLTFTHGQTSAPKVEAPKEEDNVEAPKVDVKKELAAPKEEAPKVDAKKEVETPKEDAPKVEAPKVEAPKEEKVAREMKKSFDCDYDGVMGEACDCDPCAANMLLEKEEAEAAAKKTAEIFPPLTKKVIPTKSVWVAVQPKQEKASMTAEEKLRLAEEKARLVQENLANEANAIQQKAEKYAGGLPKPKLTTLEAFRAAPGQLQLLKTARIEAAKKIATGEGEGLEELKDFEARIEMFGIKVSLLELYSEKLTKDELKARVASTDTPQECMFKAGMVARQGLIEAVKQNYEFLDATQRKQIHDRFVELAQFIDNVGKMRPLTAAKRLYAITKPALTEMGIKHWDFVSE